MASTTDVIEALRYTYATPERILYLMNEEKATWSMLKRKMAPMGGRGQFIMPILHQNAGSWTGITEGGAIPAALQPDTAEALFSLQEFSGSFNVTWKLLQDARNSKFGFQTALKLLDESVRRRIVRLLNADVISTGFGSLGTLGAADNDTTITVNSLPIAEKGMLVDVIDASALGTPLATSRTVTAVNPLTNEITISGAAIAGSAAGDFFTVTGTVDATTALHTHGLLGVIDDANPARGVYGNIDRSVAGNEYWEAAVLSNGGTLRTLTEDLIMQAEDSVRVKSGAKPNVMLSNLPLLRRYHELLRADTYFALGSVKPFDGGGVGRSGGSPGKDNETGRTPYTFGDMRWHADPYFAANTMLIFDTDHYFIGHGENELPRPESEIFDGRPFFRQTSNTTYEVAWYYQSQLLSDNPAAGCKIEDLAEV